MNAHLRFSSTVRIYSIIICNHRRFTSEDDFDPNMWLVSETNDENLLMRSIRAMERQENAFDLFWMLVLLG